jgi:predicted metal-binding protein
MVPAKIRKVRLKTPAAQMRQDLKRYSALAQELGATDARAIPARQVTVDERVTLKCCVPKCFGYGTSANCPPHSMTPAETRQIVGMYRWGVAVKLEVPPEVIVRDKATIEARVAAYQTMFKIVNQIESAAFYDGHYLAVGFAAGSCKSTFCFDQDCLVLKGQKCRLALRARPSMESVGIDCYRLAAELGWAIYPIGSDAKPSCIPYGTLMGLVLVE